MVTGAPSHAHAATMTAIDGRQNASALLIASLQTRLTRRSPPYRKPALSGQAGILSNRRGVAGQAFRIRAKVSCTAARFAPQNRPIPTAKGQGSTWVANKDKRDAAVVLP